MKTFLPIILIVVFSALAFTSCTKSDHSDNGSNYCNCYFPYKSTANSGQDSIITYFSYSPIFSLAGATQQCALEQDTLQKKYPGITCSMQQ